MMRLWTCTDHDGFWPVGVASIVLALTEDDARASLTTALQIKGLNPASPFTLQEIDITKAQAIILNDGDY